MFISFIDILNFANKVSVKSIMVRVFAKGLILSQVNLKSNGHILINTNLFVLSEI